MCLEVTEGDTRKKGNWLQDFLLRGDTTWQCELWISSSGHPAPEKPPGDAHGKGRFAKLQSRAGSSDLWELKVEPCGEQEATSLS